jgi:lipopolysaccharide heptosyltransferase II
MESKRILIFNVNWLGDVLFSTATIRNVRRNYPDSFISCAIPSRCYPILKGNPYLDEIIIFDEKEKQRSIIGKLNFVKYLKQKKFDIVFLLHRSFSRALLCWLAGIPERIGFYTRKRAFLLTKKVIPPERDSLHRIDYYLSLIEKTGFRAEDRYSEFFVSEDDRKIVEELLKSRSVGKNDLLAGINPGGNWLPKRWPVKYWARLADMLIAEFGYKVIITGSDKDIGLVKDVERSMLEKPIVAAAALNIKQLGALFKRLDLFISADTGPLHIANAVGAKKIIALLGPTSQVITGPFPTRNVVVLQKDIGCKIPCYRVHCKDNRCMKAITPENVLDEIKKFANSRNNESGS